MEKIKQKVQSAPWVAIFLFALVIGAPGTMLVRIVTEEVSGTTLAAVRFGLVALVLAPFAIRALRLHWKTARRVLPKYLLISLPIAFGGPLNNLAVAESSASFAVIVTMLTPLLFAIFSTLATRDKISRNSVTGLILAIAGAVVIMLVPLLVGSEVGWYGWLPIVIFLIYMVISAMQPVVLRKGNETGVPLIALMWLQFCLTMMVSVGLGFIMQGADALNDVANLSWQSWLIIAYMVLAISIAARWLNTKSYEHIGTATTAAGNYFQSVLSAALPIVILHETLTWEMLVGGGLIIAGLICTRAHSTSHRAHLAHVAKMRGLGLTSSKPLEPAMAPANLSSADEILTSGSRAKNRHSLGWVAVRQPERE